MNNLTIYPICALDDNYIWVLHDDKQAIVIDAGESEPVMDYLNARQLSPIAFIITHHNAHASYDDHTAGLPELKRTYTDMTVYGHDSHDVLVDVKVDEGDEFELCGLTFKVWRTAGHTDTHLSYLVEIDGKTHVFCGDTLFSGGCGRVFSGTIDELYDSLMRFDALPSDTLFYPAHEYTLSNLKFGAYIEPHNEAIGRAIVHAQDCQVQGKPTLPVSLNHEQAVNVFLRVDERHIQDRLMTLGRVGEETDARQTFKALRLLKNEPFPT